MSSARSLSAPPRKLRLLTPIFSRFVKTEPRRRLGLDEKLERRRALARRRGRILVVVLSCFVIAISVAVARVSTNYTPIPAVGQ